MALARRGSLRATFYFKIYATCSRSKQTLFGKVRVYKSNFHILKNLNKFVWKFSFYCMKKKKKKKKKKIKNGAKFWYAVLESLLGQNTNIFRASSIHYKHNLCMCGMLFFLCHSSQWQSIYTVEFIYIIHWKSPKKNKLGATFRSN